MTEEEEEEEKEQQKQDKNKRISPRERARGQKSQIVFLRQISGV